MQNKKKFKIIPAIDIRNGRCVRLVQGDYDKEKIYADDPCDMAKRWDIPGVEIIHVVDLDGAKEGRPVNINTIAKIADSVSAKIEVGGGIRTKEHIKILLDNGAERVILGTTICENPSLAEEFVNEFGSGRIVAGIDVKNGFVATRGWLESSGNDPIVLAEKLSAAGIQRMIYTDISTDGMLSGPNIGAVREFCFSLPNVKIISSGGIAFSEDIRNLFMAAPKNLEGVIIGKALYEGKINLDEAIFEFCR